MYYILLISILFVTSLHAQDLARQEHKKLSVEFVKYDLAGHMMQTVRTYNQANQESLRRHLALRKLQDLQAAEALLLLGKKPTIK